MKPDRKEEYKAYMMAQLTEIVNNYDPGVMWFDGDWTEWWTPDDGKDIMDSLWTLRPKLIINNRAAGSTEIEMVMSDFGNQNGQFPERREQGTGIFDKRAGCLPA